jgi:CII-binding regulator of phage lambda lysogenization HflD
MPPDYIAKMLDTAVSLGISFFALWVISKKLWASQEEHLSTHKERINTLEAHSEACDRDRTELHRKHADLQTDVIDKLTKLIENQKEK